ncbi:hypothetical protein V8C40DRAFT_260554 [Trichoderma camerunense]
MDFFANFPLTGAQQKTSTLMNEYRKRSKISCCAAASETYDGNANEGDDEAEYYQESEDEDGDGDGDGDGQDHNEDKQQHDEDENEQGSEKAKGYLANQQACAHDFDRVKLHDVQIRSLKDRCAHMQEHDRIEKKARMDLQLTVEKLMQRVENLEETIRNQEERTKRNKETIKKCNMKIDALEKENDLFMDYFRIVEVAVVELQTTLYGP